MKKNFTTVECPCCHTQFEIPAHEHVATGMVIGEDSGLGTVYLKPKGSVGSGVAVAVPASSVTPTSTPASAPKGKASRLDILSSKGVDTSEFFSLANSKGEGIVMKWVDGIPVAVTDAELDELEKSIIENGYIKNTRLYRRWLLAQMCHMLDSRYGYTESLHHHGYMYQWKQTIENLRVLSILETKDKECFDERSRWFTRETVAKMLEDHIKVVKKFISGLKVRKCKRVPYVRFRGTNIFVSDLQAKVYNPIEIVIQHVKNAKNYAELYRIVKNAKIHHMPWNTKQSPAWIDAYKGEGAFYAMKNLILFHDCRIVTDSAQVLDKYESMAYINRKADEYKGEGWRLFGLMKKLIEDNNFNFKRRMHELGVKGY